MFTRRSAATADRATVSAASNPSRQRLGPQITVPFPVGNMQGYLDFKGYGEFAAENRASGWNAWVTFSASLVAPATEALAASMVTKAPPRY